MKRNLFYVWGVLLILSVFATGCIGTSVEKQLNVEWHITEKAVNTMSASEQVGGGIQLKQKQYGWVGSGIEVHADVNGDTEGEFEFRLSSDSPSKRIANNILQIRPEVPEKGSLVVSSQGLEVVVDYEVFPRGVLNPDLMNHSVPYGFNFVTGQRERGLTKTLYTYAKDLLTIYGNVAILPENTGEDWLVDFANINNLHEYEYNETTFEFEDDKIYLVKCGDEGYAAVRYIGGMWTFIYKYSETGVFE